MVLTRQAGYIVIGLAMLVVWAAYMHEKVAYAVIVAIFGFVGFYFSEIAKQAVRARHIANQGWAYLLNTQHSQSLESAWSPYQPLVDEWVKARRTFQSSNQIGQEPNDFTSVDKEFREKITSLLSNPQHIQNLTSHFTKLKATPGKIDLAIRTAESAIEDIQSWKDWLPDGDIALLGPAILTHTIGYRTATRMFWQCELAINSYLKATENISPGHFINDLTKLIFYVLKSKVELETLKPLVSEAKQKTLYQLSLSLVK